MTGSTAVTRPLAGRCTCTPCAVRTWIYGSRFETRITSSPENWSCSRWRSVSGFHRAATSSCSRRSFACRAAGRAGRRPEARSSGRGCANGRITPSPRSIARTPATQPRQLRCATAIVINATATPRMVNRITMYLRVSSLRRCAKLMSCSITSVASVSSPRRSPAVATCTAPWGRSSTKPVPVPARRLMLQSIDDGKLCVLRIRRPSASHSPSASSRSSAVARSSSASMREFDFDSSRSPTCSSSERATNDDRMSRSRTNQRCISESTSGTER